MMIKIGIEYSKYELDDFKRNYPDRYNELCKIIGEFALSINNATLGIDMPTETDKGCVSAIKTIDNGLVDVRYF